MTSQSQTITNKRYLKNKSLNLESLAIWIMAIITIVTTFLGIMSDISFWDWAWDRHANPLSWIIRPLFIPIICFYAYQRNLMGVIISWISVISSMYWFPKPSNVNHDISHFLKLEQEYLLENWTIGKIILFSFVPLSILALIIAFWKRSTFWGIIVVNLIAFVKSTWSVLYDGDSGWMVIPFAIIGLIITDLLIIFALKQRNQTN